MSLSNDSTLSQRKCGRNRIVSALALAVAMAAPQFATAQEETKDVVVKSEDISVVVNDGKVVIRKNGKVVKEFDVSELPTDGDANPKSRILQRVKVMQADDEDAVAQAKAILIGPEGEYRTLLGSLTLNAEGTSPEEMVQLLLSADSKLPKFAIGVSCAEPTEALAAQLNLNRALVVERVVEGSAAATAGLQLHDVVIKVDGKAVKDTGQLVTLVQKAGKLDAALKLKIVRAGKPLSIVVKPVQRTASAKDAEGMVRFMFNGQQGNPSAGNLFSGLLGDMPEGGEVEIGQLLPGVIQQRGSSQNSGNIDKLSEQIAELSKQVELLREEIRNK